MCKMILSRFLLNFLAVPLIFVFAVASEKEDHLGAGSCPVGTKEEISCDEISMDCDDEELSGFCQQIPKKDMANKNEAAKISDLIPADYMPGFLYYLATTSKSEPKQ